jgi:hypothetical protein
MTVTPYSSIKYYHQLLDRYGQKEVSEFIRFYIVPGFGHFTGPFKPAWDSIGVLDAWVDKGQAP